MMLRRLIILVVCSLSLSAWAVEVAPATTDDMNNFESTIEKEQAAADAGSTTTTAAPSEDVKKKAKKSNFGQLVSAKAKEQKGATVEQRKEMGEWVSSQKRQNSGEAKAGGSSADHRQGAAAAGKSNSEKSKGKK